MRPALKLNAIEQEHLQELYDAAGIPRDQLPYSEQFTQLVEDFQNRTFKNAEPEQVYGALLKYVRSSTVSSVDAGDSVLTPEQVTALKGVLKRYGKGAKLLPHSTEVEAAHKEFSQLSGTNLSPRDFWMSIIRAAGRPRKPPKRAAAKAAKEEDDDSGGDDD